MEDQATGFRRNESCVKAFTLTFFSGKDQKPSGRESRREAKTVGNGWISCEITALVRSE